MQKKSTITSGVAVVVIVVAAILLGWFPGKDGDGDSGTSGAPTVTRPPAGTGQRTGPSTPKQGGASRKTGTPTTDRRSYSDAAIQKAVKQRRSDVQVTAQGVVTRILPNDEKGSRHQRFIVKLPSGGTVLIAHNIDLAPPVPLKRGDEVAFCGEYEWNDRGGVVHWTHHDPRKRHPGGWIRHSGRVYE